MRRIYRALLAVALLACLTGQPVLAHNGETTVYVTNTGECYHRGTCGYLRSKNEITLEVAVTRGYRACSVCKPPKPDFPYEPVSSRTRSTVSESSGSKSSGNATPPKGHLPSTDKERGTISLGTFFLILLGANIILPAIIFLPCELVKRKRGADLRAEHIRKYGGMSRLEIARACGMPNDMTILPDGLPHRIAGSLDRSTVYISKSGSCYHRRPRCGGANLRPINASELKPGLRPCSRCGNDLPDMSWYRQYRSVLSESKRLALPEPPLSQ